MKNNSNSQLDFNEMKYFRIDTKYAGTFAEIKEKVEQSILLGSLSGSQFNIHIGTDSQNGSRATSFVTIIVLHEVGKGARGFYCKYIIPQIRNINERLFMESVKSIEFAYLFMDLFEKYTIIPYVHADVNPNRRFKSSSIVDEVVGYINAQGFEVVTKPCSWVSSHVCDHLVKSGG